MNFCQNLLKVQHSPVKWEMALVLGVVTSVDELPGEDALHTSAFPTPPQKDARSEQGLIRDKITSMSKASTLRWWVLSEPLSSKKWVASPWLTMSSSPGYPSIITEFKKTGNVSQMNGYPGAGPKSHPTCSLGLLMLWCHGNCPEKPRPKVAMRQMNESWSPRSLKTGPPIKSVAVSVNDTQFSKPARS